MTDPILPGATLGVLGGGQLGRMFTLAARRMGYRITVFAPDDDTPAGQMALILVGAMLVAGMETVWSGSVTPPHGQPSRTERFDGSGAELERGKEMGRFNAGSTVILLFPENRVRWSDDLHAGSSVRMGQGIGRKLAAAMERTESAADG